MKTFLNRQHKIDFDYLMTCHVKYGGDIPNNEWTSTCYIIAGIGTTDTFLAMLRDDMSVDYTKLLTLIRTVPSKQRILMLYAIQLSNHRFKLVNFNEVVRHLSLEELTLLLTAVDTNYFEFAN